MNFSKMFPETNLVNCVFAFRQSNSTIGTFDKYDCLTKSSFNKAKRYMYRVPEYLKNSLKVGDAVVVHCQTGFQLAHVDEINAISHYPEESFAPVVCKVDLTSYFEEVNKKEALELLKSKIEAEKKRLESMITYDLIAEKNPEFKAMLDNYKEMGGEF